MKKFILAGLLLFPILTLKAVDAPSPANWITAVQNQNATNTWICFRKEFTVTSIPQRAIARIAADTKYWLWVNGKQVVFEGGVKRGPNPEDTYYDSIELAPYLHKENNTISILLWHYGKSGFSHNPSGKAALFFDCQTEGFRLVSDESWKAIMHPAYFTPAAPIPNYRLPESNIGYDARLAPKNWTNPDFKGVLKWPAVKIEGMEGDKPWGKLYYRIIPQWKDYGLENYIKTELKHGTEFDTLKCTLPYNTQITPYLKIESEAGSRIIIRTDNYNGGGPYNIRAEYITAKGQQEYESYGWMNGHQVWYLFPKNVKILEVKYRETTYNTEFAGSFECNDSFLNQLWSKASRTLMVTMRDTYMDCPDRERSQWWGDEVNESGEAFYALDPKSHLLMKKGMYELIGWQKKDGSLYSPIPSSNWDKELPEQMLAAIGKYGFWNYYINTGDRKPIEDLYDGVKRYLSIWTINDDGSIKFRKASWNWGDWGTNIDMEGLYNVWYYIALDGARKMADLLGKKADSEDYEKKMENLKKAFNASFWTGTAYRSKEYTKDTDDRLQALAVVAGMTDKDKYPAILEVLKSKEYASPYMEKYVTEALFQMGYGTYGIERMKKRFANMVNDTFHTTLYEGWSIMDNDFGGGTSNHAWSGGGLTILSQYVCGISPLEPGYKVFSVLPQPAGLASAKAKVSSVKGIIKSGFTSTSKEFRLTLTVPDSTSAIAGIPKKGVKKIYCNNKLVWSDGKYNNSANVKPFPDNSDFIKFKVPAGSWNMLAVK